MLMQFSSLHFESPLQSASIADHIEYQHPRRKYSKQEECSREFAYKPWNRWKENHDPKTVVQLLKGASVFERYYKSLG